MKFSEKFTSSLTNGTNAPSIKLLCTLTLHNYFCNRFLNVFSNPQEEVLS